MCYCHWEENQKPLKNRRDLKKGDGKASLRRRFVAPLLNVLKPLCLSQSEG